MHSTFTLKTAELLHKLPVIISQEQAIPLSGISESVHDVCI